MNLLLSLEKNAALTPNKIALSFFDRVNGVPTVLDSLTYQQLVQRAHTVADYLREQGAIPGERVLVILPQSLDYMVAFFGCLYAQLIAVSLYPPKGAQHLHRVNTVLTDANAHYIIADQQSLEVLYSDKVSARVNTAIRYLNITDAVAHQSINQTVIPVDFDSDTPAYLQYTSGSTGDPKGVMVSHANLQINLEMQQPIFDTSAATIVVSWLPLSHDMGLIGAPLTAVYWGGTAYLFNPMSFIRQPRLWLEAISHFRGTLSWAPNFAYDLCVKNVPKTQRQGLDLSSWQVAVNAAEPVRIDTLKAFIDAYQPYGFNPSAMRTGYGLAEATLMVTAMRRGDKLYSETLDTQLLQTDNIAVLAAPGSTMTTQKVSNGKNYNPSKVYIVDPGSWKQLKPRSVGEIWVSGLHICAGYWQKIEINKAIFSAYTAQGNGPCLRTGDLGYMNEQGDLFIVGRLKDVIIIRGKNYAAVDIEQTVVACHSALKTGFVAAFSVDRAEQEQLIVLVELRNPLPAEQSAQLIALAQKQLRVEHGITAQEIVLVGRGALAKTTSGKLQRQIYKRHYLTNQLPCLLIRHPVLDCNT